MPDWNYHTIFNPLFKVLSPKASQNLIRNFFKFQTRLPMGHKIIDFLGHMAPDPLVVAKVYDQELASQLVMDACIDPDGRGIAGFERMGFGMVEVGPIKLEDMNASLSCQWKNIPSGFISKQNWQTDISAVNRNLRRSRASKIALAVTSQSLDGIGENLNQCLSQLDPKNREKVAFVVLSSLMTQKILQQDVDKQETIFKELQNLLSGHGIKLLIRCPVSLERQSILNLAPLSLTHGFGIILAPAFDSNGHEVYSPEQQDKTIDILKEIKAASSQTVVGTAIGCHDPSSSLKLKEAGTDLIFLNSGFVKGGPGLPKRINNTIAHNNYQEKTPEVKLRPEKQTWFWGFILGASMFMGGIMAFVLAATTVIMPYDESLSGLTVEKILSYNPRIFDFMSHDRATLAGTMFSLGLNYMVISYYGIKRGYHWAKSSLLASSFIGFLTFFAFLGYGYLDLFHAFVTLVLLQFFLLAFVMDLPDEKRNLLPPQKNTGLWKLAMWGQLLFVVQGVGLIMAGLTILIFGSTTVFVPTDLGFLNMAASQIAQLHENLIPLIAHDRTTFGGMLVSSGVFVLLTALWGFERGRRWLWWLYLVSGFPPYIITLWIHFKIGYEDFIHLLPVYIGMGILILGLILSFQFLLHKERLSS